MYQQDKISIRNMGKDETFHPMVLLKKVYSDTHIRPNVHIIVKAGVQKNSKCQNDMLNRHSLVPI